MSIVLEHVSYVYNMGTPMEKQALYDVSCEIRDGEFVGLIGHTGSGKSTLVQHLNGLLLPTSGRVLVDGVDIAGKGVPLRTIRQKVGMVFQYPEHQLFGETVFEDVAFGPRNIGISEDELPSRVANALAMVDLDFEEVKDRSPFELSGGQKRRVAIAGVLAMRPKVLVLDEPTAGLDPRGRNEILSQIQRLHREWQLTVVLVTHSMEDIARLADRLIVMAGGRIVLEGPPNQVFTYARELQEIGLGVPQVTDLLQTLRQCGWPVRTDAITIDEAQEEILKVLETKKHGHV